MLSKKCVWSDHFSTCWFCSKPMCVDVNFLVTSPGPNQSQTDLFESFRQRCFPKRFLVGAVFHILVLFKTYVCRCKLFGDQPGPQAIPNGPFRTVPATVLSKRASGRSTCSTDWPCSKPVCVDACLLVISPGPDQSETDLFKSCRQRCSSKGFLTGVRFPNTGPGQGRVVPM